MYLIMKEIKFYYVDTITKEVLYDAKAKAYSYKCMIRLLWRPNKWNPEQTISITSDTTDDDIERLLKFSRGPWGM